MGSRVSLLPHTLGLGTHGPPSWMGVRAGAVLHLRERIGQTLGVAVVLDCVQVPDEAPLRLDAVHLASNAEWLGTRPTLWGRSRGVVRLRG